MDVIGDENSEWEYEYSLDETEDYYVILELPDEAALAASKPKTRADEIFADFDPTKPKKKAGGKKRRRGANTAAADTEDAANDAEATTEKEGEVQPPGTEVAQALSQLNLAAAKATDATTKGLQIMDLESDEPMIMYQGQMYACQWASSIGSDILFARPPTDAPVPYNPLHSFRDVDILGIAAAKLIASPATIERKDDALPINSDAASAATANADMIHQANFLSKLADVRVARGEEAGNLKTLAESVINDPGAAGERFKKARGGRKTGPQAPRRKSGAKAAALEADLTGMTDEDRMAVESVLAMETPTLASTRTRRASTRSRSAVVDADEDEEMQDV